MSLASGFEFSKATCCFQCNLSVQDMFSPTIRSTCLLSCFPTMVVLHCFPSSTASSKQTLLKAHLSHVVLSQQSKSNEDIGQWNRIEDPEVKSHSYRHLLSKGKKKKFFGRKDSQWCLQNETSISKTMTLDLYLHFV